MRQPFPLAFWSSHPSVTHYALLKAASWDFLILKAFPPFSHRLAPKELAHPGGFGHDHSPIPHFAQTYPKVCLILYSNSQSSQVVNQNEPSQEIT